MTALICARRDLLALLLAGSVSLACSGSVARNQARLEPVVVEVPPAGPEFAPDSTQPPSALPAPKARSPMEYYVGSWDGIVETKGSAQRKSWQTVLKIESDGTFRVNLAGGQGHECGLSGRLRVSPRLLFLDVEDNDCDPDEVGTLERPIVSKTPDEFVLRTPDAVSTYRYTRRVGSQD